MSTTPFDKAKGDAGRAIRTIGWLGDTVGEMTDRRGTAHHRDDGQLGYHECEMCGEGGPETHGEFFIDLEGVRYILPDMVLHYITDHGYTPPDAFLSAVRAHWREEGRELLAQSADGESTLSEAEKQARLQKLSEEAKNIRELLEDLPHDSNEGGGT
jgi:hypothetical protein